MNRRAHVIGAGMAILVLGLLVGVFANNKISNKFSDSVNINFVLGSTTDDKDQTSSDSPYSIDINNTVIGDTDEATHTKRITVYAVLKNNTSSTLLFSPGLNTKLVDTDNIYYDYTAQYLSEGEVSGGPIDANQQQSVTLDYIIPANSTIYKLELSFEAQITPLEVSL